MRTTHFYLLLLFVATFGMNCSEPLRITSSWKAPEFEMKRYNKVMVLGIIRDADRNIRIQMENHLVSDLKDLGYNALSAYQEYGPKVFQDMTEEQARKKLAEDSIDAVLTIVLLDKERERHYVTYQVMYSPYVGYHNHVWGYYNSLYARIESPGYYAISTNYFWESNFYDLSSNVLLYSVQTKSFDPVSLEKQAHEYGQKIIAKMVKEKVLTKQESQSKAVATS